MSQHPTPRVFKFGKLTIEVAFSRYHDGGLAVQLYSIGGRYPEPYATLSVNLPPSPKLPKGYFMAKTWSENAEIAEGALASGHFRRVEPLTLWPTGFVSAELWQVVPRKEILDEF